MSPLLDCEKCVILGWQAYHYISVIKKWIIKNGQYFIIPKIRNFISPIIRLLGVSFFLLSIAYLLNSWTFFLLLLFTQTESSSAKKREIYISEQIGFIPKRWKKGVLDLVRVCMCPCVRVCVFVCKESCYSNTNRIPVIREHTLGSGGAPRLLNMRPGPPPQRFLVEV